MESISLNSFVLLEHLAVLLTSTLAKKLLTQKLLKNIIGIINFAKPFLNFIDDSKFQVGLGLSCAKDSCNLNSKVTVYKLKRIVGSNNFSAQFIKIISHYKKIGYNINVLQQTALLVVNPIMVGNFAFLFNCTLVGLTSDSMTVPT